MIEGLIKFTDRRIFSLPCVKGCGSPVETSAFNAEAPTEPAGETVGCRRQLGGIVRLILYEFVKSLSHFFVPKKRQLPLQGSLCRTTARVVPTVRRRLHRIVRNSLWLSLAHYATPPFPQKSRSACLFGCKRPHNGSLSLPTFADCGQPQGLSLRFNIFFNPCEAPTSFHYSLFTFHSSLPVRAYH